MRPILSNVTTCYLQKTSGVFDGTLVGFAGYQYNVGGTVFQCRALEEGIPGNDIKIALLDIRPRVATEAVILKPTASTYHIVLRTDGTTLLSTAAEIVALINDERNKIRGSSLTSSSIGAAVITDGALVSVAETNFTAGLDAEYDRGIWRHDKTTSGAGYYYYYYGATENCGLFYFCQNDSAVVTQIDGSFSSPGTITANLVTLDRSLTVITNESVEIATETTLGTLNVNWRDLGIHLQPNQGIEVICALPGTVRVYVKTESQRSYL